MKQIVPQKVIIEFDGEVFHSGIFFYKINNDGVIGKLQSIGIKNAEFSKPAMNEILQSFIRQAGKTEAVNE
ncbi:MAG: hypothetical protein WC645_00875 [Candidatus Margulisiibacteriota bacterium]